MGPESVAGLRGGTRPLGVLTGTGVSWMICGARAPTGWHELGTQTGAGADPDLERWVSAKTRNTKLGIKTEGNKEISKARKTKNKVQTLRADSRCMQTSKYKERHGPTDRVPERQMKREKRTRDQRRDRHTNRDTETNAQEERR